MKRLMLGFVLACLSSFVTAQTNKALSFDGGNSVTFSTVPAYNGSAITVEAWVKATSTSGDQTILNWNSGGHNALFRTSGGRLQFGQWNGASWKNAISSTVLSTTEWTHVAYVNSGGNVQLYINGEADGTAVVDNHITPTRFDIASEAGGKKFNGSIDEVRIWSTALDQTAINVNMHLSVAAKSANLAAYWKFSLGEGNALVDYSGNNHTGTLDSSPAWVASGAQMADNLAGNALKCTNSAKNYVDSSSAKSAVEGVSTLTIEFWAKDTAANTGDQGYLWAASNAGAREGVGITGGDNDVWKAWYLYGLDATDNPTTDAKWMNVGSSSEWCHFALVFDGTAQTLKGYIDGVEKFSQATSAVKTRASYSSLFIGKREDSINVANSNIDEVRIWSTARTQSEIVNNRYAKLNGDETGLALYYDFNVTSGNTIADKKSGSSLTASVQGSAGDSQWGSGAPIAENAVPLVSNVDVANTDSLSTLTGGGLEVSVTSFNAGEFALVGQIGNAAGAVSSDINNLPDLASHTERVWYIDNQSAQALTLTFDFGNIDGGDLAGTKDKFVLLRRDDVTGEFNYVTGEKGTSEASSVSGTILTFTDFSITGGYYAVGGVNSALTPALGFSAEITDNILTFSVSSLVDASEFRIETLENGEWATVTTVPSTALVNNSYSVELSENSFEYRITVIDQSGFSQTFDVYDNENAIYVDLKEGWNLLSVPFDNADLTEVFAASNGQIWAWNNGSYQNVENLEKFDGLWIFAAQNRQVKITGEKSSLNVKSINNGWNLTGPSQNIEKPEGTTVYSWLDRYNELVDQTGVMVPGVGYWIYSESAMNINF